MSSCKSCKFFETHVTLVDREGKADMLTKGNCKRFPPTVVLDKTRSPIVFQNNWCGEYVTVEEKI